MKLKPTDETCRCKDSSALITYTFLKLTMLCKITQ